MTRQSAPVAPPVVLTVAGSDSGGGAGIQADLKTIESGGAFGTSAITSVTAQNTRGVHGSHRVPVDDVAAQIDAVIEDFDVAAVKTGMLADREVVETVTEYAPDLPNLVVDPVMVAASGDRLLDPEAEEAYEDLLASATLVTPNADEAEVLTGIEVGDVDAAREAGEALVELGADAALVKGGHVPGDDVVDTLVTADAVRTVRHDRVADAATHGSGCTLSSAIATRLAHGDDLPTAVEEGVGLLSRAVRYGLDVGHGPGAVHHAVEARNEAAREETVVAVAEAVERLREQSLERVLPPEGGNVAGATPYAETPADVAGVDGGVARTLSGARPNAGVRFGAAGRLAPVVLAVREVDPTVRFAVTLDGAIDDHALAALDGPVVTMRGGEGGASGGSSGSATERSHGRDPGRLREIVAEAVDGRESSPAALRGVPDRGTTTVLAPTATALVEATTAVIDAASD